MRGRKIDSSTHRAIEVLAANGFRAQEIEVLLDVPVRSVYHSLKKAREREEERARAESEAVLAYQRLRLPQVPPRTVHDSGGFPPGTRFRSGV